jgi:hypothetical protein
MGKLLWRFCLAPSPSPTAQDHYASGKIEVMGAIVRKGNVVCRMIEDTGFNTNKARERFVRNVVSKNVSLVATDEAHHYRHLSKEGLPHEQVTPVLERIFLPIQTIVRIQISSIA